MGPETTSPSLIDILNPTGRWPPAGALIRRSCAEGTPCTSLGGVDVLRSLPAATRAVPPESRAHAPSGERPPDDPHARCGDHSRPASGLCRRLHAVRLADRHEEPPRPGAQLVERQERRCGCGLVAPSSPGAADDAGETLGEPVKLGRQRAELLIGTTSRGSPTRSRRRGSRSRKAPAARWNYPETSPGPVRRERGEGDDAA